MSNTYLNVNGIKIWDFTNFVLNKEDYTILSEQDIYPKKLDDDYVEFCKWEFNIKALIYDKATSDDILKGWHDVFSDLKIDRIFILFLNDTIYNLYLTQDYSLEPDIVILLRLVYWYHKCKKIDNNKAFSIKMSEIKRKLTQGLLNKREDEKNTINIDSELTIDGLLSDFITQISRQELNQEILKKISSYRIEWFKAVWNVVSELMFAAIAEECNYKITFSKINSGDADFNINGYPVQMKTKNVSGSLMEYISNRNEIMLRIHNSQISEKQVIEEMKDTITKNIEHIEKAIQQKSKIIFLNATNDNSGFIFNLFALNNDINFSLESSLASSFNILKKKEYIPLIFCACGFYEKYIINSLTFKIPVMYDEQGNLNLD